MRSPPTNPQIAETAPADPMLTSYDEQLLMVYLRLLDAAAEGADWRDVARVVLKLDPNSDSARAEMTWRSHFDRAKWLSESGYRHLLRGGAPQ